jgi:hypothetical protein
MEQIERTVEAMRRQASGLEYRVAADLVDIEQSLKVQSAAIESSRTAMSQTDDLVERVVEVLESLQTTVLEQTERRRTFDLCRQLLRRASGRQGMRRHLYTLPPTMGCM